MLCWAIKEHCQELGTAKAAGRYYCIPWYSLGTSQEETVEASSGPLVGPSHREF